MELQFHDKSSLGEDQFKLTREEKKQAWLFTFGTCAAVSVILFIAINIY